MKLAKMTGLIAIAASACWGTVAPEPTTPASPAAPEKSASAEEPARDSSAGRPRNIVQVKDIVQPVKIEKQEVVPPIDSADPDGVEGGVEGGVVGGDLRGAVAAPPPPPPPPPQNVSPAALEAMRIAGTKLILPDPDTQAAMAASGKERLVGSYKLCVTAAGNISAVTRLKSTGFPAYDEKIIATIRDEWRYRSLVINGKPAAVCTAVTFIYSQDLPPPPPARKK